MMNQIDAVKVKPLAQNIEQGASLGSGADTDQLQKQFDQFGRVFNKEQKNQAAQLHQSQITEQKNRTGLPQAQPIVPARVKNAVSPEDKVLNPHIEPTVRPTEVAHVDTAVVNPAKTRDRRADEKRDHARSEAHIKANIVAKTAMRQFPTHTLAMEGALAGGPMPDFQAEKQDFQIQMRELARQDAALAFDDQRRNLIKRQMQATRQNTANQMEQTAKKMAEKAARTTQQWIWRAGYTGSSLSWPANATLAIIVMIIPGIIGLSMWMGNAVTTIFQTSAKEKIIKGPLSWMAPPGFNLKSMSFWGIDFGYGILAVIVLLAMILLALISLLLFGMMFLSAQFAFEALKAFVQ